MQSNEIKILQHLLETDAFRNKKEIGIAKSAIDNGYDSLSEPQKMVLKQYFNPKCEGDLINTECPIKITKEEFVSAIDNYLFLELISCSECLEQAEYQKSTIN